MPTLAFLPISSITASSSMNPQIDQSTPTLEVFLPSETPTLDMIEGEADTPTMGLGTFQTFTPTFSSSPQPNTNAGKIQLLSPGPLSKVISPISIYGYTLTSLSKNGRVDLIGEDGRLLASKQLFPVSEFKWAFFNLDLSYKNISNAELGRISVSTLDAYGRENAVYSIHLFLLSEGTNIVYPSGNLDERCIVESPQKNQTISGGSFIIHGEFKAFNPLPLSVRLIGRDRSIIASQSVSLPVSENGGFAPFQLIMNYSVSSANWVLLEIKQNDDRIPGTAYLYSQEVYLLP